MRDYLSDLGLSQRDINSLGRNPTAVDHRFQRALLDAARYRALQQAPRAVATRAIPPVAKPGRGEARHSAREMNLQQLEYELARTGSEEAGWRLLQAKMRN